MGGLKPPLRPHSLRFADDRLAGEYQPPPIWPRDQDIARLGLVRAHPGGEWAALRISAGPVYDVTGLGVWNMRTRELAVWVERGADACWLGEEGSELLVVSSSVERSADGGVPHRLQRLSWPGGEPTADLCFELPQCCIEQIFLSPSGRFALTFQDSGLGDCGYELFSVEDGGIQRLDIGEIFSLDPMQEPPAFSPAERYVVSVTTSGDPQWWMRGGTVLFGRILVHDLDSGERTRHRLELELPSGWVPDVAERWRGPAGPEFLDEERFRIRYAGENTLELELPLPEAVLLPLPSINERR